MKNLGTVPELRRLKRHAICDPQLDSEPETKKAIKDIIATNGEI